jgi:hypothetical protein
MGHLREYRNGLFSTALIENSVFAESLNMIGSRFMRMLPNGLQSNSKRTASKKR